MIVLSISETKVFIAFNSSATASCSYVQVVFLLRSFPELPYCFCQSSLNQFIQSTAVPASFSKRSLSSRMFVFSRTVDAKFSAISMAVDPRSFDKKFSRCVRMQMNHFAAEYMQVLVIVLPRHYHNRFGQAASN